MLSLAGGTAFALGGSPLLSVPRAPLGTGAVAGRAFGAGAAGSSAADSAALAQHGSVVAAICGLLVAARRRATHKRSRVVLGPTGGCWYEYKFRAKPGDKWKYRTSTDVNEQEFGVWPPEAQGRLIKYGELLRKGVPQGPKNYLKEQEEAEAAKVAAAEGVQGALLADCDGTLVETERDGHRVAFNQAFKEKGYDCEWGVELYGELLTTGGGKERMARYFTDYDPEAWTHEDAPAKDHPAIVELHALKTKLFMEIVRSGALPLREGVEELLGEAAAAGWALAVCSTSNEEAVRTIVETMLPKFAPSMRIFAGDMVSVKKPDPEIYLMASKELGLAPMKCVVLEDARIGVLAGKAAGMQVIVTKSIYTEEEDFSEADQVVSDATELDFESDVSAKLPQLQLA